ncbi:MAG: hypothetical protein AB7V13_10695 [Pseudorhodoplanes sp.]|uniref:capsular polysaccharide export protein, LipB/KpsS family n=1 Tax=Pseudorhodoplanes sp. TaxID=1934341 RepID=UPI003D09685F
MRNAVPGAGAEGPKILRVLWLPHDGDDAFAGSPFAHEEREFGMIVDTVRADPAQFCQRQPWEDDPAQVAELDALIRDCEMASGVSAGRILLAGERDLGRGFSKLHFEAQPNAISRRVATDVAEPFRIVRRMFAFARDTLARTEPDLVATAGWGDPLNFAFHLLAKQRAIACAAIRPSPMWIGRCYWTDTLTYSNLPARVRAAEKCANNEFVSTDAQNYVESFRSSAGAKRAAVVSGSNAFREWRQRRFFHRFDNEALSGLRYFYFAMQEDPSESLNLRAPFWANQYNTAALLTGSLPAGYKLLVHEHPNNVGRRPNQYYEDLSRLPGIVMIDGTEPRVHYVANAALIVTENGPAGWEGLLLGRPVITLADSFYEGAGLARRLRDPEQLSATVVDLLAPTLMPADTDDESRTGWILDAEWETTAPVEDHAAVTELLRQFLDRFMEAGNAAHPRPEAIS